MNLVSNFTKQFRQTSQTAQGTTIDVQWEVPLDHFSITVACGPSGSGKTTFLRCLAGLEKISSGFIHAGQLVWADDRKKKHLSPQRRNIGFCFQEYALFPHLNLIQNVVFSQPDQHNKGMEIIERFQLSGLEKRYPHQLSGGEKQRASLARSLINKPRLLLIDEPFSALDEQLKFRMRRETKQILTEFAIPAVIVSHDRNDALTLAENMIVFHQGKIHMHGTFEEVFSKPVSPIVAGITGIETVVKGKVKMIKDGLAIVEAGDVLLQAVPPVIHTEFVYICIRGEDVVLSRKEQGNISCRNHLSCKVTEIHREGALIRVGLSCGFELSALITQQSLEELNIKPGEMITALMKFPAIYLIPC